MILLASRMSRFRGFSSLYVENRLINVFLFSQNVTIFIFIEVTADYLFPDFRSLLPVSRHPFQPLECLYQAMQTQEKNFF